MNLSDEAIEFIASEIPFDNFETKLLYSGRRDGWYMYTFHYLCDNIGPTVTFFKSENSGSQALGYTSVSWDSYSGPKLDDTGFFISIDPLNKYEGAPNTFSLYCGWEYGPAFNHIHVNTLLGALYDPLNEYGICWDDV